MSERWNSILPLDIFLVCYFSLLTDLMTNSKLSKIFLTSFCCRQHKNTVIVKGMMSVRSWLAESFYFVDCHHHMQITPTFLKNQKKGILLSLCCAVLCWECSVSLRFKFYLFIDNVQVCKLLRVQGNRTVNKISKWIYFSPFMIFQSKDPAKGELRTNILRM